MARITFRRALKIAKKSYPNLPEERQRKIAGSIVRQRKNKKLKKVI